jgi:Chaperone of endosialidase
MGNLVFQATLGGQVNLVGPNTASTFNLNVPATSSTLATLTGTETFTNKTLTSPTLTTPVLGTPSSGTLTNCTGLPNAGLVNSSVTVGSTSIALGATATTVAGLTLTNPAINGFTGDTSVINIGSNQIYKDTSGNVGIGGTGDLVGVAVQTPSYTTAYAADLSGNSSVAGYGSQLQVVSPSDSSTVSGISLFTRTSARSRWDILNVWSASYLGSLVFRYRSSASSTAEAMRIDSSGNVGIGTTSPVVKLQSAGGFLANGSAAAFAANSIILDVSSGISRISAAGADNSTNGTMTFNTANANASGFNERMRIISDGKVLVGCTSAFSSIVQGIQAQASGSASLALSRTADNGAVARFFSTSTEVGNISITGSTTSYNITSDYRLKENIAPMTGALSTVSALKPVTYKWKVDGSDGQGFIAHELQAVVPDAVTGEKDALDKDGNPEYQSIDTSFLVATLTAAIQELKSIVDAQSARIATLEAK